MKKLIFILCSAFILSSCSKDEYSLTKVGEFKKDDNQSYNSYLFINYKIAAYISSSSLRDGYYPAVFMICPNKNEVHSYEDGVNKGYVNLSKGASEPIYYWYCPQCRGRFNLHSGKPENDKAQGYSLSMYRISLDKDIYTIWK